MANVKTVMDAYRTEAEKINGALGAALALVNTNVEKDEDTLANSGVTATKLKALSDAGDLVTSTLGAVNTAMTATKPWGMAVAAV